MIGLDRRRRELQSTSHFARFTFTHRLLSILILLILDYGR
jgi:hypothetical protein